MVCQRLQNVNLEVLALSKGSLWITIYFNLRFLILSIWQVFMGKQLSHSWRGHLKYAFLAFRGIFFFSFKSVAWLRKVWKHFPNVSSFFTLGNLPPTLGSYKLKPISQPNCHSFRQHQFVISAFCGHSFENRNFYLHAFFSATPQKACGECYDLK